MRILLGLLTWIFSRVPPRRADHVARPLAGLVWRLSTRLRTVSLRNLALCFPDMSDSQRKNLARAGIHHYVRNAIEAGLTWHAPRERIEALALPPAGLEHLREASSGGRGVLVLMPHFGSWELFSVYLSAELTGGVMYKPGDHPGVDAAVREKRERFGLRMLPATGGGLRSVYRLLSEGHVVGLLPDQEPRAGEGRFAPFFGVPALTGVVVPRLLQSTGARAVFAVCERCPQGRYRVNVLAAGEALYAEDIDTALAALNRGVERCIAIDPAQYLWAYKRFRARPEGEGRIY